MRPGLCAEKPAGNRRHRRQGPAATDASLSHLFLSRLPAPELSVLPRAGRKICHAILASLSPAKKAGAPKGVAAIFRCRWRRSSIMAGCLGQDGDDEGILFEMNWMHLLPERWLRPAGTARTGPAPTIAEGGPFRVHTLVTSLCRRAVWGLRGGWGVVVVVAGREAQSSLVSQPCQPHHLAASTTLSASSASRSPEQRLPYPGPCFTTTTSPVPGWPSALLMHRHPSPFRHMGLPTDQQMTLRRGGKTPQREACLVGLVKNVLSCPVP